MKLMTERCCAANDSMFLLPSWSVSPNANCALLVENKMRASAKVIQPRSSGGSADKERASGASVVQPLRPILAPNEHDVPTARGGRRHAIAYAGPMAGCVVSLIGEFVIDCPLGRDHSGRHWVGAAGKGREERSGSKRVAAVGIDDVEVVVARETTADCARDQGPLRTASGSNDEP